ncbi:YheU family protein [Echinimonas agarilytica]|uniref:YheU family protein n=1 Tax=Echinimonas agarilytica TaxID=1215918 RepID=A0AA41W420_9GAMM|nr:YheU family protein [Echinimonas agarilytica]MCM2678387.1 YheU family protein [Echinimonas agarilytica]
MIIPIEQLPPETLTAIIEAFVLREGTDYGADEATFDDKIEHVRMQLNNGTAVLVYSELHESVDIVPANQFESD